MGIFGRTKFEKQIDKVVEVQIDRIKTAIADPNSTVPIEFGAAVAHNCRKEFRSKIIEECKTCIETNEPGNQPFTDPNFGVFMMLTTFPWTTEETILKLRRNFSAHAVSYMGMRNGLIFDNWPDKFHKYYFHLLICLGENQIEGHAAYGDCDGSERHREFHETPESLMSEEEKERVAKLNEEG